MNVRRQLVTRASSATQRPAAGGLIGHVSGVAGNHTLMRKLTASESCSHNAESGRLAVSAPGDSHEREADRIAGLAMNGSAPAAHSSQVHTQRQASGSAEPLSAPPIVEDVVSSAGRSLDGPTRGFMEERFGHDFSSVRVHTDPKAALSARQVGAVAYTVGHHMVFDSARYAPQTSAGRRLLAHELSHTIQQGGAVRRQAHVGQANVNNSPAPRVGRMVQRSLGFEFQTSNIITTSKGKQFGRKAHGAFHKGKSGVELQSDTGSVVEFETKPARKWSEVKAQIQEAVDICYALNHTFGKESFSWTEKHRREQMFTFSEEARIRKKEPLAKDETLVVKIVEPSFSARVQSTEGLAIADFESFLKEHEKTTLIDPVIKSTTNIVDAAKTANPKIKAGTTDSLRGFLALIVDYLKRAQTVKVPVGGGEPWQPVKAIFGLMSRTNFASIYKSLLTPDEKKLFEHIINSNAIPNELKLNTTDPLFKNGYWGHHKGMMALFKEGKIIALAKENEKGTVHDCSSKAKPPSGLNISACGTEVKETNITIDSWLKSIIKKDRDLLSPPARGSTSMGKKDVKENLPEEKGLVLMEARGTRREAGQKKGLPINNWVPYTEEVFHFAAECRPRPGTGTELIYDGDDIFSWDRCLPPK